MTVSLACSREAVLEDCTAAEQLVLVRATAERLRQQDGRAGRGPRTRTMVVRSYHFRPPADSLTNVVEHVDSSRLAGRWVLYGVRNRLCPPLGPAPLRHLEALQEAASAQNDQLARLGEECREELRYHANISPNQTPARSVRLKPREALGCDMRKLQSASDSVVSVDHGGGCGQRQNNLDTPDIAAASWKRTLTISRCSTPRRA